MRKRVGLSSEAWDKIKREYLGRVQASTGVTVDLGPRRSSRWARTKSGWIAITGSSEDRPDTWFLGLDGDELDTRPMVGAVLLCVDGPQVLDFGFSGAQLKEFRKRLSRDERGEIKLMLRRQDDRYLLQIPGGGGIDVSGALGDVSWLQPAPARRGFPHAADHADYAFFARVRAGVIEPLDPPGLRDGEVLLVRASRTTTVPGSAALRRMLAVEGPTSLPADFAERHDTYAHGVAGN